MVTSAASASSTPTTVSSVLVHAYPTRLARLRRAASTSERWSASGITSCGSRDTSSPAVTTLPSSASRSISGDTTATISGGPVSVTRRASTTGIGVTVT
jgi:hypothetical protein